MKSTSRQFIAFLGVLVVVAACGGGPAGTGDAATGPPQRGGSLTVLESSGFAGSWPSGLDPATNTTGGANLSHMNAIFSGLFKLVADDDGSNARVEPEMAKGHEFSDDGKTVRITLRDGIQFSDGTPLNAEAVAWNWKRDVDSPCTCAPNWPLVEKNAITTEGDDTVVLKFTRPYAAMISSLVVSNANWIASPTAFKKMGEEKFKIKPVGAGPFTVVSNQLSSELRLKRNENYWKENRPYLDNLTIKSIGSDQAAYQAILAGQAQAYEGMVTTPLIEQAKSNAQVTVTQQPATSPYLVQLNTSSAPFNNKKAREAIYYATNVAAIRKGLFKNWYPAAQTFTGPGGLFHQAEVPGYRTYDLAKAKQLVKELGGLTVHLGTINQYVATQVNTALQSQWEKAGINVKIDSYDLNTLIQEFNGGKWEAMLQTAGAWDPAAGVGVAFRFDSQFPFSGVKDPELDKLLRDAAGTLDEKKRADLYAEASKLISDKAYAPFILAFAPANVMSANVHGPGLSTKIPPVLVNSGVIWDEVWMSQ